MNSKPLVAIVMGSASDLDVMQNSARTLEKFGVPCSMNIMSAHRTPDDVENLVKNARSNGIKVFIAAAGMAAHLAGVVASKTTLPVIGVPLAGGSLQGMDSLLSTVQMPKGVPVATVAIGKSGAINAAILAVQILSLAGDVAPSVLEDFKVKQAEEVRQAAREALGS